MLNVSGNHLKEMERSYIYIFRIQVLNIGNKIKMTLKNNYTPKKQITSIKIE